MKKLLTTVALLLTLAIPSSAFGAIAFDASQGKANGAGTSITLTNVAPSGTDRLLMCSIDADANGVTFSDVAFGGSNFTQLGPYIDTDDGYQVHSTWYLVNPTTSSGSVTATISGSANWIIGCQSYTGVLQSGATFGTPVSNFGGPYNVGSPVDITRTSTSTGSWMYASIKQDSAGADMTISAGGSRRQVFNIGAGNATHAMFDSNAGIDNGIGNIMTINWTGGGQALGYIAAMFAPAAEALTAYNQDLIYLSDE